MKCNNQTVFRIHILFITLVVDLFIIKLPRARDGLGYWIIYANANVILNLVNLLMKVAENNKMLMTEYVSTR